ncbi:MAG: DUF4102 domain-containing protein [gamma proteobacterium endosymbiont of Lamellibrachia anaximandri]|nr:DUF4102 domain-containing protein [gamma proteobacterium endosymbiont of Lamellibrachia anaximandri]
MATVRLQNFTVREILKVPIPDKGLTYVYSHEKRPKLGVTITPKGSYTFHVRATVVGSTKRMSIPGGNLDDMTITEARRKADKIVSEAREGLTPAAKRAAQKVAQEVEQGAQISLQALLDEYVADRQRKDNEKPMKPSTADNYRKKVKAEFPDHYTKSAVLITPELVDETKKKRGKACMAAMRVLKAVYNYAHDKYELDNPVTGKLAKYGRKDTHIKLAYLPDWFREVETLKDPVVSQYLQFLLLALPLIEWVD